MKLKKKTKLYILLILLTCFVIAVDLVSKHFTTNYYTEKNIIPYLINFKSQENTGAAWSIFSNATLALIIISTIAIVFIILYIIFAKDNSILFFISFSFILGGAIGNLIDRIYFGYVRDFIQFAFWEKFPVFNIADSFLTIGIFCLILHYLIHFLKNKNKNKK